MDYDRRNRQLGERPPVELYEEAGKVRFGFRDGLPWWQKIDWPIWIMFAVGVMIGFVLGRL